MVCARFGQWIEHRWPLTSLLRWFLHEPIEGGSRYAYIFGSATLFLFTLLVVTGVWQMFYYVPTIDHAYESVSFLRLHVPFGWLIHGLHYWGATAFIAVMGLHTLRVFIWGAYKKPRELTWLLGVLLLLLGAAMIFTGPILPWDNMGYWAGEVGTSIAGTVPGIGNFIKLLIRGGPTMGQFALGRMFVLHVAILPGLMVLLILAHLVAFRQFGSVGPWNPRHRQRIGWFWPTQWFKDMVFICALAVLLVMVSAYIPAPFTGPADPIDSSYTPKPEWNFLFLYEGLKVFKGSWEQVGTIGIPVAIIVLLVIVPFIDRGDERSPRRRPVIMTCGALFVAGVVVLTIIGYTSALEPAGVSAIPSAPATPTSPPQAGPAAPAATMAASGPTQPASAPEHFSPAQVARGQQVFASTGCTACHTVSGNEQRLGPSLKDEAHAGRSASWLRTQIRNSHSHNPNSIMPVYSSLSAGQVDDLVAYLLSLSTTGPAPQPSASGPAPPASAPAPATSAPASSASSTSSPAARPPPPGPAAAPPTAAPTGGAEGLGARAALPAPGKQGPPGAAARMVGYAPVGKLLYGQFCMGCHGDRGTDHVPNPGSATGTVPPLNPISRTLFSDDPLTFAENIDLYLQHGAKTPGPNPATDMPAFGSTYALTQQQIANLEAYILELNGVNRAKIIDPGVPPRTFADLTLVVFAFIGLGIALAWLGAHLRGRPGGR